MTITKEMTRENASEVLVEYLVETGTSQAEVARKSGLNEMTISLLVNGGKPQAITVEKLKKYFKSIGA
jgi:plasmid maintenance system antidote protein VapI